MKRNAMHRGRPAAVLTAAVTTTLLFACLAPPVHAGATLEQPETTVYRTAPYIDQPQDEIWEVLSARDITAQVKITEENLTANKYVKIHLQTSNSKSGQDWQTMETLTFTEGTDSAPVLYHKLLNIEHVTAALGKYLRWQVEFEDAATGQWIAFKAIFSARRALDFAIARLTISPTRCTSRELLEELTFKFTPDVPLSTGAQIQVKLPAGYAHNKNFANDRWDPPVGEGAGDAWVVGPPAHEVVLEVIRKKLESGWVIGAKVLDGQLEVGESILVKYQGHAQAAAFPFTFQARLRSDDESDWEYFAANQEFNVLAGDATQLLISGSPEVVVGDEFSITVCALDAFGNLDLNFDGTVTVQCIGETEIHRVTLEQGRWEGRVVCRTPGPGRVEATFAASIFPVAVMPIWAYDNGVPVLTRFFGDAHFHTGSDAGNDAWAKIGGDHHGNYTEWRPAYHYARDVLGLDWAVASPHSLGLNKEIWTAYKAEADYWNDEVLDFTTFHSFEWNVVDEAHRLVYFKETGDYLTWETCPDLEALFQETRKLTPKPMISPHMHWKDVEHPAWKLEADDLQRFGEIYSWKNCTQPGYDRRRLFEVGHQYPWTYQYAWARKHTIGVIGSTDNHSGLPGRDGLGLFPERGAGGLAVVLAVENTREEIWDALYARRTYATTGARIVLDFKVNQQHMGSWIEAAPGSATVDIDIGVACTHELDTGSVVLIRGTRSGYSTIINFVDIAKYGVAGDMYVDVTNQAADLVQGETNLFYVRVTQKDGETAWSSPVWVGSSAW